MIYVLARRGRSGTDATRGYSLVKERGDGEIDTTAES